MQEIKDENLIEDYFPVNVEDGVDLLGFATVRLFDLALGIIITVPIIVIFLALLQLTIGITIGNFTFIVASGTVGAIAIAIGRNGEPLTKFFANMMNFKKISRVCIYNPRIKKEIVPMSALSDEALKNNISVRDKLMEWYKVKNEIKTISRFENSNIDLSKIQFEDDSEYLKSKKEKAKRKERKVKYGKKEKKEK